MLQYQVTDLICNIKSLTQLAEVGWRGRGGGGGEECRGQEPRRKGWEVEEERAGSRSSKKAGIIH